MYALHEPYELYELYELCSCVCVCAVYLMYGMFFAYKNHRYDEMHCQGWTMLGVPKYICKGDFYKVGNSDDNEVLYSTLLF